MDHSFPVTEWKPQASAGKHSQVAEDGPSLGPPSPPAVLEASVLVRVSFSGALNEATKHSGKEDWQIADEIHISHGYMSRFLRGVGQQWAKRLVAFMRATHSVAPLQWLAYQMGCRLEIPSDLQRKLDMARAEVERLSQMTRIA
jgi:hypothetical protein